MITEYYNYNSKITLLPSLDIIDYEAWSIDKAKSLVGTNPTSIDVIDIVLAYLSLNTKQEIIVQKIMHYTMYSQTTLRPELSDQLLFVVSSKNSIGKSQVIKAINWAYDIMGKIDQIFITAPTKAAANKINGNTLHTVLEIDIRRTKVSMQE